MNYKPITEKDLDLSPTEIKELVTGAQKYLPLQEDPADLDKPFKQPLDEAPKS